jgi:hypothetical protein
MDVSLEQAIHIHARVLVKKHRFSASDIAVNNANACSCSGDHEGYEVWMRVASATVMYLPEDRDSTNTVTR